MSEITFAGVAYLNVLLVFIWLFCLFVCLFVFVAFIWPCKYVQFMQRRYKKCL